MRFTSECKNLVITDFGIIIIATDGYTIWAQSENEALLHHLLHHFSVHADKSPKSYQTRSKSRHFTFFGFGKIEPSISLQRVQIVQEKFGLTLKLLHWSTAVSIFVFHFLRKSVPFLDPPRTHMGQLTSKSRVIHVHPMLVDQETGNIKSLRQLGRKRHRRTPAN